MAKILVVEDDRQFRGMLRQMLERADYQVLEAANGDEGLCSYREHSPDLILLDMMMPGRDGLEVLEELVAEFPDVRVIAISGGLKGDTSWLEPLTLRLGVKTFLHKPFGKSELLDTIVAVLNNEPKSKT